MEFETLRTQSQEKLKVADHLVGTTYPLVREPKLLVSVIDNIFQALDLAVTALLEYEKYSKVISNYDTKFEEKINLFRRKIVTKYDLPIDIIDFILVIKKTLDEHKQSIVEFRKKDIYVISDNDYNLTTLNIEDVKKNLTKAKYYIDKLFKIIN